MKPSCVPFSGEISGSTAVIMPMPMNETELISSTRAALAKSALPKLMVKERCHGCEQQRGSQHAVDDGEGAHPQQVRRA